MAKEKLEGKSDNDVEATSCVEFVASKLDGKDVRMERCGEVAVRALLLRTGGPPDANPSPM